jgi:predicted dinucleotide-binding enzyme
VISCNKPHLSLWCRMDVRERAELELCDDTEAKQLVIELINSTGFVAIDLRSLTIGGAMHEVGAPFSGLDLHFVRRLR